MPQSEVRVPADQPPSPTPRCAPTSSRSANCSAGPWCARRARSCYDLVEEVRALTRSQDPADGERAAGRLAEIDLATAIRLVRAFSSYFYLANVTEQVHRGRELHEQRATVGSWLTLSIDRIAAAIEDPESKVSREWVEEVVSYLSVRPVFTAHPTEAARRTVMSKLRQIAGSWRRAVHLGRRPGGPAAG